MANIRIGPHAFIGVLLFQQDGEIILASVG